MRRPYEILDLKYSFDGVEQHLYPMVLFGSEDAVLLDCGYPGSLPVLETALLARGISPESLTKLLITHQDDDHMGAAAELKDKYPAIKILASQAEAPYISGTLKNLRLCQGEALQSQLTGEQKAFGERFCARYRALRPVSPDVILQPGDRFDWGGGCEILASPGHSPGHISLRALNNSFMFTGDAAVLENGELAIANPEFCLDLQSARTSFEALLSYNCGAYICYHGGKKS